MTTNDNQESSDGLPMEANHIAVGARMTSAFGWSIPAHFGDPEAEYNAARNSVTLMDASYMTVVSAKGKDHLEYLNRRLAQRVIAMQPGETLRAAQLNGDGRMEADLELLHLTESESLLFAPPGVGGDYLQQLADKYVFSEDAQFANVLSEWSALALFGPKAEEILHGMGMEIPAAANRILPIEVVGFDGWLFRSVFLNRGLTLLVPAAGVEKIHACLMAEVHRFHGARLGFLAFDTLRVEAGIPWWGIDLTEKSVPLEADLMDAIHTNKGCYPGQETIAKILNLGHPARKMVGVKWNSEDPPPAGIAVLADGAEIGKLTSSTFSPALNTAIGLAMVRWPYREVGTPLASANGLVGAVIPLPMDVIL